MDLWDYSSLSSPCCGFSLGHSILDRKLRCLLDYLATKTSALEEIENYYAAIAL